MTSDKPPGRMRDTARVWRRSVVVAVAMAFVSHGAIAADADTPALLQMTVNGVDKGAARVLLHGQDVLILMSALKEAGLIDVPGTPQDVGGEAYVRLDALGPHIKAHYDQDNLALELTVEPALLAATTIDLASVPEKIEYVHNTTGFINYALTSEDLREPSLLSEQGLSFGKAFFDDTFSVDPRGQFQRINTNLSIDNRDNLTRLTLGDAIANAGVLGGASQIAGISYAKNFSINPYFTPFPGQRFAGVVNTPSTADVYVNGLLVRTVDLPPGPFNLQNLPALSGAGSTRVVVRNAFGLTQELGAPYYLDTHVLQRGLSDFSYTAGFERELGASSFGSYDGLAGVARHRYGFTDTLTAGGFVAADKNKVAGGPEITVTLPVGTLALSGAGSTQQGTPGSSASVQYAYQSVRFSVGGAYTYMSPHYATVGLDRDDDRAIHQFSAFAGTHVGAIDLSLNANEQTFRDTGTNRQINLTSSTRLADRFNLALTLSHGKTVGAPADNGVFLSLTMAIGRDTTTTASANYDRDGATGAVQVQKSRPVGEGWAYLAQASAGQRAVDIADVQYQGHYGLYEVDTMHNQGQTTTTLSAAGAVTFIGGDAYFTRPIQDAYGLIRVPDLAGVTGYLSHQDVGKTDADGNLLVPSLLSYYGNQIGIEPQDIPLDYSVAETDRTIAPFYRGGAVVAFPVKKLQAFQGTVTLDIQGKAIVPAYGDLSVTVAGEIQKSPLGEHGEFYFESLPAGPVPASVEYEGSTCRFFINVPRSRERLVQLGQLTCASPS